MARFFPPFDPDGAPGRTRPRQVPQIPIRLLLPNIVTLLALGSGLTAIRMAFEGRFETAIYAVLFAAALDGIDGRVARLLRSTSRFGAQLDSLADFVNFGVAPALILYAWSLSDLASVGWMAGVVFAICAALRLARFNAALEGPAKPAWQAAFFVGVPAPAAAVIALLPLYVEFLGFPRGFWTAPLVLAYALGVGTLMVSRLPTWSGKLVGRKIPRDRVAPLFIALVIAAGALVSFPWIVLTAGTLLYLVTLPLSSASWDRRMKEEPSAEPAAAASTGTLQLEAPPPRNRGGARRQTRVGKRGP